VTAEAQVPADLVDLTERAREYAANAKSANTRRAYQQDWRAFEAWCLERGLRSMPAAPATILAYLTARAGIQGNTLRDASYYWLLVESNVECRFAEPISPDAVLVAVFAPRRRAGRRGTRGSRQRS
jgi:hypothetical protein